MAGVGEQAGPEQAQGLAPETVSEPAPAVAVVKAASSLNGSAGRIPALPRLQFVQGGSTEPADVARRVEDQVRTGHSALPVAQRREALAQGLQAGSQLSAQAAPELRFAQRFLAEAQKPVAWPWSPA